MPCGSEVVGVVGGGASGLLTAVHLLRDRPDRTQVVVFEPRAALGRGVAYSTDDHRHLLNVRAGCLSAFPDDPGHFLSWARTRTAADERSFLPRAMYGEYLSGLLPPVEHVQARVVDLAPAGGRMALALDGGPSRVVDRLVLALGSVPPAWPAPLAPLSDDPRCVVGPWAEHALDSVPLDAPVLLIGSGLTAVDTALSLRSAGHRRIVMLSRHGLLPAAHVDATPVIIEPPAEATARALLRWARQTAAGQPDWRPVIDGLRPHTDAIWSSLPEVEQGRLLRHAHRYWEVARHRMAPAVAAQIESMRDTGELTVIAGTITGARARRGGVEVGVGDRHFRLGAVVNCTGGPADIRRSTDPLVRRLLDRRLARPGPLHLGFDTDGDGRLPDCDDRIRLVGPLRRGRLWETTAIPEIRSQAVALASHWSRAAVGAVA
jgi:uncharacterized NAD(P)/FAD-binding protein YdhS